MQITEFNIVEVRLIQRYWTSKPVKEIAKLLDRPLADVFDQVKLMVRDQEGNVKLYQAPVTERKILKRDVKERQWADRQMAEKPKMKMPDNTGKISVKIDAKTIAFVKPGTDIEKFRKEYLKRKLSAVNKKKDYR